MFRFRALIVHQKQLLLASSAAVDLTQTGKNTTGTSRHFYKHTATEMTSLLSTLLRSSLFTVRFCERAVFPFENKDSTITEGGREIIFSQVTGKRLSAKDHMDVE